MSALDIFVVDDDVAVRDSVEIFLKKVGGYSVVPFSTGEAFLAELPNIEKGLVLLDLHLPRMSGLAIQQKIRDTSKRIEVVILTGQGDVASAVHAMKNGAFEFLEKPYDSEVLLGIVQKVFQSLSESQISQDDTDFGAVRAVERLSVRELEVLRGLLAGKPNKVIAFDLAISPRTVEIYRANMMTKLGVKSLSEAIQKALRAGVISS